MGQHGGAVVSIVVSQQEEPHGVNEVRLIGDSNLVTLIVASHGSTLQQL